MFEPQRTPLPQHDYHVLAYTLDEDVLFDHAAAYALRLLRGWH